MSDKLRLIKALRDGGITEQYQIKMAAILLSINGIENALEFVMGISRTQTHAPAHEAHSPTANLSPLAAPDATDGRKTGENGGVAACKCAVFSDRTEHGILKIVVERDP